jgi:hypothetical protein
MIVSHAELIVRAISKGGAMVLFHPDSLMAPIGGNPALR